MIPIIFGSLDSQLGNPNKAYSIQLCVQLVSALVFIIYSFLMSSVIIPSEREYSKQRTPTLPFVFSGSSVVTTIHCYADQAFKSSMFNTAVGCPCFLFNHKIKMTLKSTTKQDDLLTNTKFWHLLSIPCGNHDAAI